ncbi:hypothetical protein QUF18_11065 [Pseudochrobactrum kiredjianiae]|nr:hypothetical protein [Pseudochrobactrum kiredjianiae]MDM7851566.1 hypothetical protein [Pseudochrobactrum kiredjianiae]
MIVSPYIWAASLDGHANILGRRTNIDVPFSDIFKNLDFSAMGNIEVTNGLYGVYFDGQYTKTSQDEQFHSQTLGADITMTSLSAGAFFRAYEMPLEGETVFGGQRVFAFEPTVGVRWTQLKVDFMLDRWSEKRKLQWTDPFIGARIQADLSDRWNLFAEADIGGFNMGSDLSAQGQAYLGYRTHIFNQPVLLRFGYRALYQDYEGGDILGHSFKWNVTEHGPVAGISLVF